MNEKSTFMLDRDKLLQWSRWTRYAKRYLQQAPEEIPIHQAVEQYHRKVTKFYIWLDERLRALHKDELKTLDEMMRRLQDARGKAR